MDANMQEDVLMSQRFVCDHLIQSEKEVWEFPITPESRKSCKLTYQKKWLDNQIKKEAQVESEKKFKKKTYGGWNWKC